MGGAVCLHSGKKCWESWGPIRRTCCGEPSIPTENGARRRRWEGRMSQPRYNAALQEFIRQWRPNDPELDKRFVDAIRQLVAAILVPPAGAFEVETILSPSGGKVVLRLADYEAQLDPLDAQHLALSLVEAATSARTESW